MQVGKHMQEQSIDEEITRTGCSITSQVICELLTIFLFRTSQICMTNKLVDTYGVWRSPADLPMN
jgi:hypothetical protein